MAGTGTSGKGGTRRGRLSRIATAVALLAAVLLAAVGFLLAWLDSASGREWAVGRLERELAGSGVGIGGSSGRLFGRLVLEDIAVRDAQGVWLHIDELRIAWRPGRLLDRELFIAELAAGTVEVARLPAASPEDTATEPFRIPLPRLPRLPVDVVLERLHAASILVAEEAFGVAAALTGEGRASLAGGERLRLRVELMRRDLPDERLAVELDFDQGADRLIAEADIAGPPGGLFAAAAGARAGEALGLKLSGSGPLSAWRGELVAFLGERARLAADLAVDGGRVALAGTADLDDVLPAELAGLFEPRVAFSLDLDPGADGPIPLALSLVAADGTLDVEGTLDPARPDRLDLDVRLGLDDARALGGLAGELGFTAARLSGTLSGNAEAPEFRARLDLDGPLWGADAQARTLGLDLSGRWRDGVLGAEISGRAEGLVTAGLPPRDADLELVGSYRPADDRIRLDSGQIAVAGLRLRAQGTATSSLADLSLAGRLDVAEFERLPVESGLEGGLAAAWRLERTAGASLRLELDGAASAFSGGTRLLDALLGEAPEIALIAGIGPGDRLAVTSLTLESERLAFGISGSWSDADGGADFDWSALLDPAGLAEVTGADGLAGEVALSGRLEGPPDALTLSAESRLDELDVQGFRLLDPRFAARIENLAGLARARLDLDADSALGALRVGAAAELAADGGAEIRDLVVALGAARIEGGFRLGADGLARGRLTGTSGDLSALPESRRYGLRGDLGFVVDLDVREGLQRLGIAGGGARLAVPVGASGGLQVERLRLDGEALLTGSRPVLDLTLVVEDARTGFTRLQDVEIRATGDRETLRLTGHAEGDWRGPLDLSGELAWSGGDGAQAFELAFAGMLFGQPLALDGPARLEIDAEGWRAPPFSLLIADGSLEGHAERRGDRLDLGLVAEHLPLDLVNVVAGRLVPTGRLGARLDLAQRAGEVTGVLEIDFDDVRPALGGYLDTPAFDLDGRVELEGGMLALSAIADAGAAMHTTLSARLPVEVDLVEGRFAASPEAPLQGRLEWRGALAPLFELADFPEHEASGDVSAVVDISGALADPRVDGFLRLSDGRYEHLGSGFIARDIDFEGGLAGRRLSIDRFLARDGDNGRLEASGFAGLSTGNAFLADIRLALDRVRVVRRADVRATASGELAFTSDGGSMRASGQVVPDRVEIDISRSLPSEVVTIEVVEVHAATAEEAAESPRRPAVEPLALDISLAAPRRIFVRGRGLDSEWSVDLAVRGTSDAPEISGNAALVKGSFDFAGRRLEISEGGLVFPGGSRIDPILHLAARQTVEGLQISVAIDGPVSSPDISLSSSPPLPEDEILSRLLFGESVSDLTPLEAVQLASSLAALSGGGGLDVVGAARGALGLDRLNIELGGEDEGGTRISGGKYLNDKVYFEVATETGSGITAGTLEWSLTRNLSLRSRVESSRKNSVAIRWSWDY